MTTLGSPRVRVIYLLAVGVGVFLAKAPALLAGIFALQVVLWLAARLALSRLGRQIGKLWLFSLFVVVSYALFAHEPETDQWLTVPHLGLALNLTGAAEGARMVVRVLSLVLASQVARAGDPRAVAQGLRGLFVPERIATSLDVVLALLGEGGGGRGGGRGDGSGRRRRGGQAATGESFWASLRRLGRGDVGPLVDRMERHIRRAEARADQSGAAPELQREVAVIAGVALTMLAIKMLKVLPSLPFAPGHKLVLLTPLYIAASLLTKSRFGGTMTGIVMGTVAFLMGDGRYGIFEILKHIAPGLVCDLLLPLTVRRGPEGLRTRGVWAFCLLGLAMGIGRFATVFTVTLFVQPPAVAYAFLAPGIALSAFFGLISGWVSHQLARAVLELRERLGAGRGESEPPPAETAAGTENAPPRPSGAGAEALPCDRPPGEGGDRERKRGARKRAEAIG